MVTIVPSGRGSEPATSGPTAAQLVPPMRMALVATADETQTIQLGGADLPAIDGTLVSSTGDGLSHYRVVALGHWDEGAPLTEVSTVDYTGADGTFRIVLSRDLVGTVEHRRAPVRQRARADAPPPQGPRDQLVGAGHRPAGVPRQHDPRDRPGPRARWQRPGRAGARRHACG